MPEPIKSNLEPIEESDLSLQEKFTGNDDGLKSFEKPAEQQPERAMENSVEKDDSYGKIISKIQSQNSDITSSNEQIKDDAQIVASKTDAQSQIQHLVDISLSKGVVHAAKVAKHLQDYYVIDKFHDRLLLDEFHDALVQKGIIQE